MGSLKIDDLDEYFLWIRIDDSMQAQLNPFLIKKVKIIRPNLSITKPSFIILFNEKIQPRTITDNTINQK